MPRSRSPSATRSWRSTGAALRAAHNNRPRQIRRARRPTCPPPSPRGRDRRGRRHGERHVHARRRLPLVNDLPTNDGSQSAPVDGVIPVNVCSVVVAVAGTASNSCEPSHVETNSTGAAPVTAPVTVCAVTAAIDGDANGSCLGTGSNSLPIGAPGSPGSGANVPLTFCGIEGALDGVANSPGDEPTNPVAGADSGLGHGLGLGHDVGLARPRGAGLDEPVTDQRADGGDGILGHLVPGVDRSAVAARAVHRGRGVAPGPDDAPRRTEAGHGSGRVAARLQCARHAAALRRGGGSSRRGGVHVQQPRCR